MDVNNRYRFVLSDITQEINIPVEINWDLLDRGNDIEKYENDVIKDVIGSPTDYEVDRFSHQRYGNFNQTDINYDFYFYSGQTSQLSSSTITNWVNTYRGNGFTSKQIYTYANPFIKSFFKLDFYNSKDAKLQKNYFTIILPVQQGYYETVSISSYLPNAKIRKPKFKLDFIGDKEGFFIYWLRDITVTGLSTFYMSVKFFNAQTGQFVKLMNQPQSTLGTSPTNFNPENYFYFKVDLNYSNFTYQIYDNQNTRVGTTTPIKWYEYVNP